MVFCILKDITCVLIFLSASLKQLGQMVDLPALQRAFRVLSPECKEVSVLALQVVVSDRTVACTNQWLLESRYMAANCQPLLGTVAEETATLRFNRIRTALPEFIVACKRLFHPADRAYLRDYPGQH
ncbi:MAG: hypothetical protein RLY31_2844 [Bacteroidota bacterium]